MTPHITGPAKAANNLVTYQQDPIFTADGFDLRPVIRRRNDYAARTLDRFTDKGSDIFRSDFNNFVFDSLSADGAEIFGRHVAAFIVPIWLPNMFDPGKRQNAGGWETLTMHGLHPSHAHAGDSRTMIGIVATNQDGATMLTLHLPIMANHTQDCVIGFGTGTVKKHMGQTTTRQARNLVRQHDGRRVRGFEEAVIIWQFQHLFACDLSQFVASIAYIDAPKSGHAIQYAVTVPVMDVTSVGMGNDPAAAQIFDFLPVGLGGQVMGDIHAAKFGDVVIAGHKSIL